MLMRMSLVVDGGVLGENRDAALALEVGVVHRALGDPLVGAEDPALVEHRVDQRRLAVIDVGDDGDVAPERVGDVGGFSGAETSDQYTEDRETLRGEGRGA